MTRQGVWAVLGVVGAALVLMTRGMLTPVRGRVSAPFKEPRNGSEHNGVDVAVPVGTALIAPDTGIVTVSNYDERGGHQMRLSMSNGYTVGFAHLRDVPPSLGRTFERGDLLAYSGNTGNTTGPHVHITLRDRSGELVDPQHYFTF